VRRCGQRLPKSDPPTTEHKCTVATNQMVQIGCRNGNSPLTMGQHCLSHCEILARATTRRHMCNLQKKDPGK
jgi:hypothetical protein